MRKRHRKDGKKVATGVAKAQGRRNRQEDRGQSSTWAANVGEHFQSAGLKEAYTEDMVKAEGALASAVQRAAANS